MTGTAVLDEPTTEEAVLELWPHQLAAWDFSEEFDWVAMITGIGGGKTYTGAPWLIRRTTEYPEGVHVATANSYPQLADVVVPEIEAALDRFGIPFEWRESKKVFVLDQGRLGRILVRSTEKYNKLRGLNVDSWWPDELRDAPAKALQVMRGRMRGKRCNRPKVFATTTPNGYDHIWKEWVDDPSAQHRYVHATSRDNLSLAESYIRSLEHGYDEQLAAQEIDGKFIDLAGARAIHQFNRALHVREVEYDASLPLILCHDFNVNPMLCEIAQEVGLETHVVDEIAIRNANLLEMATAIITKFGDHRGPIEMHGDASGHSRTAQTGRTTYAILLAALNAHFEQGVSLHAPKDAPSVIDRINSTNVRLVDPATKVVHCFISPRCKFLIADCEQMRWKEAGVIDKSEDDRTHAVEGLGYYLHRRFRPSGFRHDDRARRALERFSR